MSKRKFTRRYYRRPQEIFNDFQYILSRRKFIRRTMRELIPPDFRERLMMVVTEVNGCRYCRSYHRKESRKSGVSESELKELLEGLIPQDTPAEEYVALAYAQKWAESNAKHDPQAWQHLVETYGEEKANAIQLILRMIRVGNLSGNLLDFLIFKLSFGRLGLVQNEERFSIMK
jgi:AhpD family alkylhydroperoxidase